MKKYVLLFLVSILLTACASTSPTPVVAAQPVPPTPIAASPTPENDVPSVACIPNAINVSDPFGEGVMSVGNWNSWPYQESAVSAANVNGQHFTIFYDWELDSNQVRSLINGIPEWIDIPISKVQSIAIGITLDANTELVIATVVIAHCNTNLWSYSLDHNGEFRFVSP